MGTASRRARWRRSTTDRNYQLLMAREGVAARGRPLRRAGRHSRRRLRQPHPACDRRPSEMPGGNRRRAPDPASTRPACSRRGDPCFRRDRLPGGRGSGIYVLGAQHPGRRPRGRGQRPAGSDAGGGAREVVLGQAGWSVQGAYSVLLSMTFVVTFIPFVFVFAAAIKLQGAREQPDGRRPHPGPAAGGRGRLCAWPRSMARGCRVAAGPRRAWSGPRGGATPRPRGAGFRSRGARRDRHPARSGRPHDRGSGRAAA
jgi:hypothetical protein